FVHLHLHTEFSISDGLVRIKPLVKAVAAAGMPAVAITDQGNLFALVKFYRACTGAGIKPITGLDCWVHDSDDPERPARMTFLARDWGGYMNLTRLSSKGYLDGQQRGYPTVTRAWIEEHADGLIALSGGREGDVGRALLAGNRANAENRARRWREVFGGDYYLELVRSGRQEEEDYLHAAVELAGALDIPVVATNDVRFLKAGDYEAHEARVCIQDGRVLDDPRRPRNYSEQQYLRTPAEMASLFSDIPEALENSVEIAQRCNLELRLGKNYLPDFPIPEGLTLDEFFIQESKKGLEERLEFLFDRAAGDFTERRKPYDERLDIELGVIVQMGFPGYFMIVADFIQWAKDNQIPVGPGRGSGAGSLVAYALKITDLDPLEFDLLFERFLNPERVSMPDFDVDFCMDNRDKVIDYVARKYGRDKVSQIATHGSMAAKAVVRDVGRVMGQSYGFVDRIAKLIPFEIGMTLTKALDEEEDFKKVYDEEEDVRAIVDMALKLEGLARNVGKHAGGVVISPSDLTDFSAVYREAGMETGVVTQFDKDDVEAAGLVKFDFLGLRTLTIIDWAVQAINADRATRDEELLDIAAIPMDDADSFKLLKACQTTAVFQLESRGMKDLIKRLQPDCFEDIVALVALFRPGPLQSGMVDNFINRKHGREPLAFPDPRYQHETLQPILEPTYGIILYQEQVMQIAQVLAGYTLGGADMLRRAMGKKKPEEMAKQRAVFEDGAKNNGIEPDLAMKIFDLVEKFAGYGFNKSHSAAYALVSYQTAWLKAHYPAPFMAAVLSSDMDNTDKVVVFIEECREMKLEVIPPDVNRSQYRFTNDGENTVVYGLGAIKGVGEGAIEGMIAEREANGAYKDLFDFCARIDLKKANKRTLEHMIRAGALDTLAPNRATIEAWLPAALQTAEQQASNADAGQDDLFGLGGGGDTGPAAPAKPAGLRDHEEWDEDVRLAYEKEVLGLYLTGHPVNRYLEELDRFTSDRLHVLAEKGEAMGGNGGFGNGGGFNRRRDDRKFVAAGLILNIRIRKQKNGKMGFLTLDDRTGRIEIKLFDRTFDEFQNLIAKDTIIVAEGRLGFDDFAGCSQITADKLYDLNGAREHFAKGVDIELASNGGGEEYAEALSRALGPFRPGTCPVRVQYRRPDAGALIRLGEQWRIKPTEEAIRRLRGLHGAVRVEVDY
ncbi:MAG: DNA polymerase III subunit alpha, partial [Gammaproteobacteria bacterium]